MQVDVPACPPTEAVLRVIPAVKGSHPGAQVGWLLTATCIECIKLLLQV